MISEKYLDEIIKIVENHVNSDKKEENKKKINLFFPEFEKAVKKSILFGELNKNALRRNLNVLYVKKFREERLEYITSLKQVLETEPGRNYLRKILS